MAKTPTTRQKAGRTLQTRDTSDGNLGKRPAVEQRTQRKQRRGAEPKMRGNKG